MRTSIYLESDQFDKEDIRALLQAIRLCEMATFPNKVIRILVKVPEMQTSEVEEILASIKPPYKHGPEILRYNP